MGFNELTVWVFELKCKNDDVKNLCNPRKKESSIPREKKKELIINKILDHSSSKIYKELTENGKLNPKKDKESIYNNFDSKLEKEFKRILEQDIYYWKITKLNCNDDFIEVTFFMDSLNATRFRDEIFIYPREISPITFRVYKRNGKSYLFAFSTRQQLDSIRELLKELTSCELGSVTISKDKLLQVEIDYSDVVKEASWDNVEYIYKAKMTVGDLNQSNRREEFDKMYTRISTRFITQDNITKYSQDFKKRTIGVNARSTEGTLKVSVTHGSDVNMENIMTGISDFILKELLT